MLELLLTPKAEHDLEKIFQFTMNSWGLKQAEKYQDELYAGMQLILENVFIGKIYSHSELHYRKFHINRHLIFYRIDENVCVVVRILHDRMDLKRYI